MQSRLAKRESSRKVLDLIKIRTDFALIRRSGLKPRLNEFRIIFQKAKSDGSHRNGKGKKENPSLPICQ